MKTGSDKPVITGVNRRADGMLAGGATIGAADIKLDASTDMTIKLRQLRYIFIMTSLLLMGGYDSRF
jgi:hypothetical protein